VNKDLLHQAIKCLAIRDVFFEKANAEIVTGFDPGSDQPSLAVQFKSRVLETRGPDHSADEGDLVQIVAECGMRLIASLEEGADSGQKEKALISAILVAEYSVIGELDATALQEFSDNNGLFHVWPFWREYVHSACARLRIPVVPVPMYTLSRVPNPPDPTPAAEAPGTVDTPKRPRRTATEKAE
jgi:hypothetical protein